MAGCTDTLGDPSSGSSVLDGSTTTTPEPTSGDPAEADAPDAPSMATALSPGGPSLAISVDRVGDGDSVRASSAEGDLEIRLTGINAPEGDECFGDRAADRLAELLDADEIVLTPWPAERDDFGRELGYLLADGTFVNLALVESGHAVARDQSDHEFAEAFEDAEAAADNADRGLWAADACGAPSDAEVRIVDAEPNAPGDDRENPNGEWVLIENLGSTDADLTGWSLRDESTRHRYEFPDLILPAGARARIRTGCGTDDQNSEPMELFWCSPEPPVWNNGGDTAFLLDFKGSIADNLTIRPSR